MFVGRDRVRDTYPDKTYSSAPGGTSTFREFPKRGNDNEGPLRESLRFDCGSTARSFVVKSCFELRGHQIPIVPPLRDRGQAADNFVPVFAEILAAEDLA